MIFDASLEVANRAAPALAGRAVRLRANRVWAKLSIFQRILQSHVKIWLDIIFDGSGFYSMEMREKLLGLITNLHNA